MKFQNCVLLVAIAILFVFAKQSNARPQSTPLADNEVAMYVLSQKFQDNQQRHIDAGTDKASSLARNAIENVNKAAEQCLAEGGSPEAVQIARDGILSGVRLVAGAQRNAIDSINKGIKLSKKDPSAGEAEVKKGIKKITDLIFVAGVPIHNSQGAASSIAGKAANKYFEDSIVLIQRAGTSVFEVLETSELITSLGIRAGGGALKKAEEAANEAIDTGVDAVYNLLVQAVKSTFAGIKIASQKKSSLMSSATANAESLVDDISTDVPEALDVVNELTTDLKSSLNDIPAGRKVEAIKALIQGLNMTIKRSAEAMKIAKKALEDSLKLADKDSEASIATMKKGIHNTMNEILKASADGYLGLGAAGYMAGKVATERLIPGMIGFEAGRVTSYMDLELAEKIATIGLKTKGIAAKQGVKAALQTVSAAENALYTHLANVGDLAFKVFRSLSKD